MQFIVKAQFEYFQTISNVKLHCNYRANKNIHIYFNLFDYFWGESHFFISFIVWLLYGFTFRRNSLYKYKHWKSLTYDYITWLNFQDTMNYFFLFFFYSKYDAHINGLTQCRMKRNKKKREKNPLSFEFRVSKLN